MSRGSDEKHVRQVASQRDNPYYKHHPWGPLEAALVMTLIDWKIESEMRPTFGEGSDCSDLMDTALTRIKGLCAGDLDPDVVMEEIE